MLCHVCGYVIPEGAGVTVTSECVACGQDTFVHYCSHECYDKDHQPVASDTDIAEWLKMRSR